MTEFTVAVTVFETFGSKTVQRTQKQFRMSERQRVRGTAVYSYFCDSLANLVSNTVMPPFIQKLLSLETPFRVFRVFRGSLATSLEFIIQPRNSRKARKLICPSRKPSLFLLSQALKT